MLQDPKDSTEGGLVYSQVFQAFVSVPEVSEEAAKRVVIGTSKSRFQEDA